MKYIFYHIPKTGGQTITNSFADKFIFHEELIHLGVFGINDAKKKGLLSWDMRSQTDRDLAKFVFGHYVNINTQNLFKVDEKAKHMIVFREPARHIVSLYNFIFRNDKTPPSFKLWYMKQKLKGNKNWQVTNFYRHFLNKGYLRSYFLSDVNFFKKLLDEFYFVSTTEKINRDLPILAKKMKVVNFNIKNKNITDPFKKVHFKANKDDIDFLNSDNPLDFKIWKYAYSRSNCFSS